MESVSKSVSVNDKCLSRLGDSLNSSISLIPPYIYKFIDVLACKIIENDPRLDFNTLQPEALHALAIIMSEWILHITGTSLSEMDRQINILSAISKKWDALFLRQKRILNLRVDKVVNTLEDENKTEEERRNEAREVLQEIEKFREELNNEGKKEEIKNSNPKNLLSSVTYEKFKEVVNEDLYNAPAPDMNSQPEEWIEWSKNRWLYTRTLKRLLEEEKKNDINFKRFMIKKNVTKNKQPISKPTPKKVIKKKPQVKKKPKRNLAKEHALFLLKKQELRMRLGK